MLIGDLERTLKRIAIFEETAFKKWLKRVDTLLVKKYGLGVGDATDWPSRDTFDMGISPEGGVEVWAEWQDINF